MKVESRVAASCLVCCKPFRDLKNEHTTTSEDSFVKERNEVVYLNVQTFDTACALKYWKESVRRHHCNT